MVVQSRSDVMILWKQAESRNFASFRMPRYASGSDDDNAVLQSLFALCIDFDSL